MAGIGVKIGKNQGGHDGTDKTDDMAQTRLRTDKKL